MLPPTVDEKEEYARNCIDLAVKRAVERLVTKPDDTPIDAVFRGPCTRNAFKRKGVETLRDLRGLAQSASAARRILFDDLHFLSAYHIITLLVTMTGETKIKTLARALIEREFRDDNDRELTEAHYIAAAKAIIAEED